MTSYCSCNQTRLQCVNIAFPVTSDTGAPIAGAVFRLGCSGGRFNNAISGENGCVSFCGGLTAGFYELTQLATAFGFQIDDTVHEVEVTSCGSILVDGAPLCRFGYLNARQIPPTPVRSEPPTLNVVFSDSVTIGGTGIPGCCIVVTWPSSTRECPANQCNANTTAVLRDGSWVLNVPSCLTLIPGDTIEAVQQCGGDLPSIPVPVTVQTPTV